MYLSVRHRLSLPVLVGILAVFVAVGLLYHNQTRNRIRSDAVISLEYRARLVRAGLNSALETAKGLALSTAQNQEIAAALANGNHDGLLDLVFTLYVNAGRELGLAGFSFHRPPGEVFLEVHNPGETGGEASPLRPELKPVMTEGRTVSGLLSGRDRMVVMAINPVEYEGRVVGAVEFALTVNRELLERYVHLDPAFDISVVVPTEEGGFRFAARNHNLPILESSHPMLTEVLNTGQGRIIDVHKGGRDTLVYLSPLMGMDDRPAAVLGIPLDATAAMGMVRRSLAALIGLGLTCFIIVIALVYWSSGMLLRVLGRITETMVDVARNRDLTRRVAIGPGGSGPDPDAADGMADQDTDNPEFAGCWVTAGSYSQHPVCRRITEDLVRDCRECPWFKSSLSHELEVAGSILNHLLATFASLVRDSQKLTYRVAETSDRISEGAGALNDQTQAQAAAVQEIAAGMEELNASVGSNVQAAQHAEKAAANGHELAVDGRRAVDQAVTATRAVADKSKDITAIVDTVKEVAFRTNLLALNASVEAARAGEAGRGFAVVAGEVRSLAQQTAEAATMIQRLLTELVAGIRESDERIGQAGEKLGQLVVGAERTNQEAANISLSSQEQARAIQTLGYTSTEIDRAAQTNATLGEQAGMAARALAESAQRLRRAMGVFVTQRNGPVVLSPDGDRPHNQARLVAPKKRR